MVVVVVDAVIIVFAFRRTTVAVVVLVVVTVAIPVEVVGMFPLLAKRSRVGDGRGWKTDPK